MKVIQKKSVIKRLREHFDDLGGKKQAAAHYRCCPEYLDNILRGATARRDILEAIGVKRELVKTERFYEEEKESEQG